MSVADKHPGQQSRPSGNTGNVVEFEKHKQGDEWHDRGAPEAAAEDHAGEHGDEVQETHEAVSDHVNDQTEGGEEEDGSTRVAQDAKRTVAIDVPDSPPPSPPALPQDKDEPAAGVHRCLSPGGRMPRFLF